MSEEPRSLLSPEERRSRDSRRYFEEWRLWFAVSVLLTLIWAFRSWRTDGDVSYWPRYIIGIWALVLIVAPLFPSSSRDD